METLKIGFSLQLQEYACDNKYVRPLITRSVYTRFWPDYISFTIIHFVIELFFWYNIHKSLTYNLVQKLALFCINIVPNLSSNHARDSITSSYCRIRSNCKLTASVYLLSFFLIVDCETELVSKTTMFGVLLQHESHHNRNQIN